MPKKDKDKRPQKGQMVLSHGVSVDNSKSTYVFRVKIGEVC